ncbi:hypothetical protein [Tahibacter amnicola]|uniref:Sortilin (Neurotensin receptor 3) n=1 Tax=Tahibacter amnicola TaxID=2976241 RepID=A0ABY6BBA9_9GAMM|nr:hypothetical protein [Tahibacter amnicola]UXI67338.1 hypothetical protein N4264_21770 [Tahibacter amnicola]
MRASWLVGCFLFSSWAAASTVPESAFDDLRWRLVGPFRAGWSTVAAGDPRAASVYYFGAAGGGVWKTTDGGHNWFSVFDQQAPSIGALAVAPSDSNVIYVGSGQPQARYDTAAGDGVYGSRDGGKTWQHLGLGKTRHIGAILVDPKDANTLLVGALGPYYAESADRGVFRSTDGGKTWTRTLAIDDATGVVDLAADPANPQLVYAAAWTARNYPWMSYFTPMSSETGGIYRSTDGGQHWQRLQNGLPGGVVGRIGIAATSARGKDRVYAVIDHAKEGGLYRSDDAGEHWQLVHKDGSLASRYFSRITAHPKDPDTVFIMGRSMKRSTDAGRTLEIVRGSPGGDDYHFLWIDPANPDRRITGSDQGAVVTTNGGASWSDWYNQPTGQFYCLHADKRVPYWLYAGQQDNGTIAITSRSDYGAISFRDWHPVGADERDCDVPDPTDPNIVYGSGLGGRISRFDRRTGDVQNITPVLINTYGKDPRTIEHRWSWITPLTISPVAPHALYLGSQVLFRSDDRGDHWVPISPDLTGRTASAAECPGTIPQERAKACGFGVIFHIAPSPHDADEIWVGTDSGLVQRTRDGGKSWQDVTPRQIPEWATVARIDISRVDRNRIYLAVDQHRANVFEPLLLRSTDGGATWSVISNGLPAGEFTSVIRSDSVKAGLLFAATDRSVYTSWDDGENWHPLKRNLPNAWVRDMLVIGDDVAIATQGRALWILDNISRLREFAQASTFTQPTLFAPPATYRYRKNQNKDTPLASEVPLGENPPAGAMIEYFLPRAARHVVLTVTDASGRVIRRYASDDKPEALVVDQYFNDQYRKPAMPLPASAGAHRFLWDLRHPRPAAMAYEFSIAAVSGVETSALPEGPLAIPGDYTLTLDVDGRKLTRPLTLKPDPRLALTQDDYQQILAFNLDLARVLKPLVAAVKQLSEERTALQKLPPAEQDKPRIEALTARLEGIEPRGLQAWADILAAIAVDAESAERLPTAAQRLMLDDARRALGDILRSPKE